MLLPKSHLHMEYHETICNIFEFLRCRLARMHWRCWPKWWRWTHRGGSLQRMRCRTSTSGTRRSRHHRHSCPSRPCARTTHSSWGPKCVHSFVILSMHAFPAKRPGLLQTSCMQRLPKSYPLLDSPDPSSTQSTVGLVLNICAAPLGLCWRVHAYAAPICPAVQTMMRNIYCS